MIRGYRAVETEDEYARWTTEIPFIRFKEDWEVKVIPPSTGAIVRFRVRRKNSKSHDISVYLDCYNRLGMLHGGPYWEIYPYQNEDVYRCKMEDVEELVEKIEEAFGNKRRLLKR